MVMALLSWRLWGLAGGVGIVAVGLAIAGCSSSGSGGEPKEAGADGTVADSSGDVATDSVQDSPSGDTVTSDAGDGGVEADAAVEDAEAAVPCNSTTCGGACCGGTCVHSCATCDAGSLMCPFSTTVLNSNGFCVDSCSACDAGGAGAPVSCAACSFGTLQTACAPSATQCSADINSGACSCTGGDAGACPLSTQVCSPGDAGLANAACLTCGQSGTDGLQCSGGGSCTQATGACAP